MDGRDNDAKNLYQMSCRHAEKLLPHWLDTETAAAALVVSYQNLADLYFRQENHDQAISVHLDLLTKLQYFRNKSNRLIVDRACRRLGTELSERFKEIRFQSSFSTDLMSQLIKCYFNPNVFLIKNKEKL